MGALSAVSAAFLAVFGLGALLVSLQLVFLLPLSLVYGLWKRRALGRLASAPFRGRVTVIVPAHNEERTLRACVDSVLASDYPDLEVVVVDDGSSDGTAAAVRDLAETGRIQLVQQANGGKARALNRGASLATGEVFLFTDADSLFLPGTVGHMARWFSDPSVHAVCGNDAPLAARAPLQKALAVTTHIGTGFVRRALSVARVLPIITGNLGAVRAETFREVSGFAPVWGEDLDFTFRLQKARRRIVFEPEAMVRADCPATLSALWRQRVRWARSYIKIVAAHRELLWPPRSPPFSLYLPLNAFAQVVVPLLQILSLPVFVRLALTGGDALDWSMGLVFYLGLLTFLGVAVFSILLDRSWSTLRYVPLTLVLIVPLSYFYNLVVLASAWKETTGEAELWHKIERSPTGSRARWGGVGLLLVGASLLGITGVARFLGREAPLAARGPATERSTYRRGAELALATHFDGWGGWRQAVASVLENPDAQGMRIIGLGAGRPEWTFFRWEGHRSQWSSTQRGESVDLVGAATEAFRQRGFRVVPIVDLYAPGLIQQQPAKAAVRFDGERSPEQVEFMELVDGAYGRLTVEMLAYIARSYAVDGVALTEAAYKSFCFDEACLRSYGQAAGRTDWPRTPTGVVDRDDPSVWKWRSARMESFVAKAARAVHAEGKRLYVDVPVSWDDISRHGRDSGLDYASVLRHADRIVVWNYFAVEGRGPEVSLALARDLSRSFPPERVFMSLGLWSSSGTLAPGPLGEALAYTLQGGIHNLWITPNHMLTAEHWRALRAVLSAPPS